MNSIESLKAQPHKKIGIYLDVIFSVTQKCINKLRFTCLQIMNFCASNNAVIISPGYISILLIVTHDITIKSVIKTRCQTTFDKHQHDLVYKRCIQESMNRWTKPITSEEKLKSNLKTATRTRKQSTHKVYVVRQCTYYVHGNSSAQSYWWSSQLQALHIHSSNLLRKLSQTEQGSQTSSHWFSLVFPRRKSL